MQSELKYTITKTWDSRTPADNTEIEITLRPSSSSSNPGLNIEVEAPFYNDPKSPPLPPGRVDGLWDYEVVEIFFLGANQKYLEIELGPHDHYLVYYLEVTEGTRNVTKNDLLLKDYKAEIISNSKWRGQVTIPAEYLPPNVNKFNAYGIHGSDPNNRVYMSLFPVEEGKYDRPNFHRLEPFGKIELAELLKF